MGSNYYGAGFNNSTSHQEVEKMEVEEEGEESDEEQEDDQALVQRHDVPIPEETHNKKSFFKQHKVDYLNLIHSICRKSAILLGYFT